MYGFKMRVKTDDLELVLRPYQDDSEVEGMLKGVQSYAVGKFLSLRGAQTLADEKDWLEKVRHDQDGYLWAVCVVEGGIETPVGHTSITIRNRIGTSGIMIYDRDYWRRGVAKTSHLARTLYAFDVLDLIAIRSGFVQQNRGSGRALKRMGYRPVGITYHQGIADGNVIHVEELLVTNPTERAWNYFWGDTNIPKRFVKAREVTTGVLEQARQVVEYL